MLNEQKELEKRRQAIVFELGQRKAEAARKNTNFDLNNLRGKLPGGTTRWVVNFAKLTDKPMHERGQDYEGEVSELSFDTTNREFFTTIDEIIQHLESEGKISLDRLQQLIKIIADAQEGKVIPKTGRQANKELEEALEPLYVELRLKGFSHYDLWE